MRRHKRQFDADAGKYIYKDIYGEYVYKNIHGEGLSDVFGQVVSKLTGAFAKDLAKKAATKAIEKGSEKIGEKTGQLIGDKIYDKFKKKEPQAGDTIVKLLQSKENANAAPVIKSQSVEPMSNYDINERVQRMISGSGKIRKLMV